MASGPLDFQMMASEKDSLDGVIVAILVLLIGFVAVYGGISYFSGAGPMPGSGIVIALGVLFIAFLFLKYAIRSGVSGAMPPSVSAENRPGTFRVYGVDKNTQKDVSADYQASSAANAKVKAELNGVIVTSVDRVS